MADHKPRLTERSLNLDKPYDGIAAPNEGLFDLPEKVLQFGTGRFLRGFADYVIDRANNDGRFDGRVVVVQSTGSRRTNVLNEQDGLFTLCQQGVQDGELVETYHVVSAISRVLSASDEWTAVLECAANPHIKTILSNTTEAGLRLDPSDLFSGEPPTSFPAKLTRFLHERFRLLGDHDESGFVILPCELIEGNGELLRSLVEETARRWDLGTEFSAWLTDQNVFCNCLVDRIVVGYPPDDELPRHEERLPFRDAILTCSEPYLFWAIEGDASVVKRLPFAQGYDDIVIEEDISPYFERKVRILNGGHTLMSPISFLVGHETVRDAMDDAVMGEFVRRMLRDEIAPTLPASVKGVETFVQDVIDRWSNPFLNHSLHDITMQSTRKMRARVIPTIRRRMEMGGGVPERIAFGFAGFLAFVKAHIDGTMVVDGQKKAVSFEIDDDLVPEHARLWERHGEDISGLTTDLLGNVELWGTDLTIYTDFVDSIRRHLERMLREGPKAAMQHLSTPTHSTDEK